MILVYRQTSESIKYLYSESTQVSVFVLDNVVMCLCCQFPRYIVRAASTGLVQSQHEIEKGRGRGRAKLLPVMGLNVIIRLLQSGLC